MNRLSLVALATAIVASGVTSSSAAPEGAARADRCAQPGPYELPQGDDVVDLDPSDFTTRIDNPYWPMRPGTRWVPRETDDEGSRQKVVVTVTNRTKRVASGIVGRVVRDTVTEDGQLVEDTFDWYAQDRRGNIWYLGEDTTDYENGRPVSKEGSFEDGVNAARRGIVMLARPRVGREYREERAPGEAEDEARVLSRDGQVEVPFGHFTNALMTRNVNPLEPKTQE